MAAPAIRSLTLLLIPLDESTHVIPLRIRQICHASDVLELQPEGKR
jgi:hypothetical protein